MEKDTVFETCFNHIVANQYQSSYYSFAENYYKYPDQVKFLYGVVVSHVLLNTIKEGCSFLEAEKSVSPHSYQISLLHIFIKKNNYFDSCAAHDVLFNIGLFLKNNNYFKDSHVFFRVCQVLQPENSKTLALMAESSLLENDVEKGIRLFAKAAAISK